MHENLGKSGAETGSDDLVLSVEVNLGWEDSHLSGSRSEYATFCADGEIGARAEGVVSWYRTGFKEGQEYTVRVVFYGPSEGGNDAVTFSDAPEPSPDLARQYVVDAIRLIQIEDNNRGEL